MRYSLFYYALLIIFFTELNADDFSTSNLSLLRNEYKFDEISDNGSYDINFDEINTDVIINGHIGSGAIINIYYFSNISDSLEKQSNFLSLYNYKSHFLFGRYFYSSMNKLNLYLPLNLVVTWLIRMRSS